MRITNLRIFELTGYLEHEGPFWEDRLSRPVDVYPEHNTSLLEGWTHDQVADDRYQVEAWFLEIETDEGVTGLGGPGTRDWMATNIRIDPKAKYRSPWVEGYASRTSVRPGESLSLHVSTNPASPFVVDVYRM